MLFLKTSKANFIKTNSILSISFYHQSFNFYHWSYIFNHWSYISPCGYHDMKVIDLHSLNNEVSYDKTVDYLITIFTDLLEKNGKKF